VLDLVVEQLEYQEQLDFVEQLLLILVEYMVEVYQLNVHLLEKEEFRFLFNQFKLTMGRKSI